MSDLISNFKYSSRINKETNGKLDKHVSEELNNPYGRLNYQWYAWISPTIVA